MKWTAQTGVTGVVWVVCTVTSAFALRTLLTACPSRGPTLWWSNCFWMYTANISRIVHLRSWVTRRLQSSLLLSSHPSVWSLSWSVWWCSKPRMEMAVHRIMGPSTLLKCNDCFIHFLCVFIIITLEDCSIESMDVRSRAWWARYQFLTFWTVHQSQQFAFIDQCPAHVHWCLLMCRTEVDIVVCHKSFFKSSATWGPTHTFFRLVFQCKSVKESSGVYSICLKVNVLRITVSHFEIKLRWTINRQAVWKCDLQESRDLLC